MTKRSIWWIRRDLRLADNQALAAAMEDGDEVLPVFVLDKHLLNSSYVASRRVDFLTSGLVSLDADLRAIGSRLIVRRGDPVQELGRLCQQFQVSAIHAERDVSPYARRRDDRVADSLKHVQVSFHDGISIRPIGDVRKADGSFYTVFTPYSRRWRAQDSIRAQELFPQPTHIVTPAQSEPSVQVKRVDDSAGEQIALERLNQFTQGPEPLIFRYARDRDRPDLSGTSMLSPYLRFGMISSRTAAVAAYEAIRSTSNATALEGADTWLSELIWRDFYLNILYAFPTVRENSFRPEYDRIAWQNSESELSAWQHGQTGYPFVDAAMRQLLAIGWMHNRARMVVASFLVKDLLVDWRMGERWFMQQLLDGDPAANNGGWQWSAGTGTDAAPYFRIFNPISQGKKFDPDGDYVRTWVPELAHVAKIFIHEPWKMSMDEQRSANCRIGQDYPQPIVDHAWARKRTLAAYQQARNIDASA